MIHEKLFDAITANTDGDWVTVFGCRTFSLQTILGGSVVATGGTITLEGSNDGSNVASTVLVTFTIGTDTNKDIKYAVDKPVAFVRAKLASLSGGTSPTVTAILVAV